MQLQGGGKDRMAERCLPPRFIYCILEQAQLDGGLPPRPHGGPSQHPLKDNRYDKRRRQRQNP